MTSLRVTRNTRAKGEFIAAGTVLDETNSDAATMKEINASGKGEWIAAAVKESLTAHVLTNPEAMVAIITEDEPPKKRGRPRKE